MFPEKAVAFTSRISCFLYITDENRLLLYQFFIEVGMLATANCIMDEPDCAGLIKYIGNNQDPDYRNKRSNWHWQYLDNNSELYYHAVQDEIEAYHARHR